VNEEGNELPPGNAGLHSKIHTSEALALVQGSRGRWARSAPTFLVFLSPHRSILGYGLATRNATGWIFDVGLL
jgi:hypothetical protein